MSADEQAFVLARSWPHLRLGDTDDYTTNEAVAAIARITMSWSPTSRDHPLSMR
ncbi:hypothetical protein B0I32_15113 [Nonomuraea fuscirosea]|uniref:Uncharacterized protein n=1 Tax=Nonomuraea fuscirosea TaxID=1291556 RepID=A0A2T0LMS2_9ACTN|nr:hypothetical protein [Nonomuraea fuscirosea]PRX44426.1 hypothetical protein B0I32_15113 [Nonomuraea fuscirosea]